MITKKYIYSNYNMFCTAPYSSLYKNIKAEAITHIVSGQKKQRRKKFFKRHKLREFLNQPAIQQIN